MSSYSTLLLCLHLAAAGHVHAACTSGFSDPADFQTEGAQYLRVQSGSSDGIQVIIPEMRFTCHGYITNWTALTVIDPRFAFLTHQIYFQLWRPVGKGRYRRIDGERITVIDVESNIHTTTLEDEELGFYRLENEFERDNTRIYFQPSDILGYFIKTVAPLQPLNVVFRNATASDDASMVVNMYSYRISTDSERQPCEISTCGANIKRHLSVVPQISVNIETIDPASPTPEPPQYSCTSISFETCLAPSSTVLSFAPSSTPYPNDNCLLRLPDASLCTADTTASTDTSLGLSTAEVVGFTFVLSSIVSFTAGLLVALGIAYCYIQRQKKHSSPRDLQQPAPTYEDIPTAVTKKIEMKENVAYRPINYQ